jgi:hypothetical protein
LGVSYWLVMAGRDDVPVWERLTPLDLALTITSLSDLIVFAAAYTIVVRWHRMIILGAAAADTRRASLSRAFLYFARALFLSCSGVSIALIVGLLPVSLSHGLVPPDIRWYLALATVTGGALLAMLLIGRFSLVLPAAAIGDAAMTLRRSFTVTRGHSWRILGGSLLSSGPALFLNFLTNAIARSSETIQSELTPLIAGIVLSLLLIVVAAVIQAGFLSYAYLFFVRRSEPPASESSTRPDAALV